MISFVDEDAGTVDIMYFSAPSSSGAKEGKDGDAAAEDEEEEEEEGVKVKSVQELLDFEVAEAQDAAADGGAKQRAERSTKFREDLFGTAAVLKEQGNALFKIKDFEAAAERYTAVVEAVRSQPRSV